MENTEQAQNPEVAAQAEIHHEKKSPQESFAELRKAKEDLERQVWQAQQEKSWMEKQLQQQQQLQQQARQPVQQEEDFDFRQLEQEDFPDGKKLVKAFGSMNKKMSNYEQKLAEKENYLKALETKLEFPDFAEVVTAENIEKYIKSDEDNRESVEKAANPLRKVYNLIKKDARYQNDIASKKAVPQVSQEQKRVEEKENKPPMGSVGVRSAAVTTAARMSNSTMSKDQRNALWKETMALARK